MVKNSHEAGIEVFSTSSTTTLPRQASTDRRSAFAGSTTSASTSGTVAVPTDTGNQTPTGTSPAAATPSTPRSVALRLILDSLRYWVTEMHVDGFAST